MCLEIGVGTLQGHVHVCLDKSPIMKLRWRIYDVSLIAIVLTTLNMIFSVTYYSKLHIPTSSCE
jgi:hypothetical protein